jgi:DNA polymerase-3 subunit gamma/tau
VDAETLHQRWPAILDAVRGKSKVAWILLNTATVQELEAGVLTIAFPSEGNARGFASSGHDQVLTGVLAALLGLNVRVRAVAGGPQAASVPAASTQTTGRPAPAQAARSRPAPARAQDGPAPGGSPAAGPAAPGAPSGDPPAAPPAGHQAESRTRGPAAVPDDGRPAPAAKGPATKGPAAKDPAAKGPAAEDPTVSGQQAKTGRTRPAPPGQQAAASAEEEWPDDAGPAGAGTEDLTGMELIRRQLGGRVIQEIEDS